MNLFKRKLAYNSYLELLIFHALKIREEFKKMILESNPKVNMELLNIDSLIFAFWVVSLHLDSREMKDDFHDLGIKECLTNQNDINKFYDSVQLKYGNLTYAYNWWVSDSQAGIMVGTILSNMFMLQEEDFVAEKMNLLGTPDIFDILKYFTFFATAIKTALEYNGKIQKKYKIQYK